MKDSTSLSRKNRRKVSLILAKISSVKQSGIVLQVSVRNDQGLGDARVNSCTPSTATEVLRKGSVWISIHQVLPSLSDFFHLLLCGWSDYKTHLKTRLKRKLNVHGCKAHWMEQATAPKQGWSHLWWPSCLSNCCLWQGWGWQKKIERNMGH